MPKTFLVLLALFVIMTTIYFADAYIFHFFEQENVITRETIHGFQMVWGTLGLMFGIYTIHLWGYVTGKEEGYEEGLEEGYDKAFNGS